MTFIERHMNPVNRGYKDPTIGHPLSPIPMLLVVSALNKGYVADVILRDFSDLRTSPENLQKRVWKAYKKSETGEIINIFEAKDENLDLNEIVPADVFIQTDNGMEISLLIQTLGFQSVETRAPIEDEFNSASGEIQVYRYVLGTMPLLKKFENISEDVLESVIWKFRNISVDVTEVLPASLFIHTQDIDIEAGIRVNINSELQRVFGSFIRTVLLSAYPAGINNVEDFDSSSAYFNTLSISEDIEFTPTFVYGVNNLLEMTIETVDGISSTKTMLIKVAYPTYISFNGIEGVEDAQMRVIGITENALSNFNVLSSIPDAGNLILDGYVFTEPHVEGIFTVPVTSLTPYFINVDFNGTSSNLLTVDVKAPEFFNSNRFNFTDIIPSEIHWDGLLTFSQRETFEVQI